ncbi:phosphoribosyltransferase family protein [Terrabacter sp. NPDC000476]|uniref:phosphoribosyltransferase family protein n=1 Tax=Terrabacter sp. NPDC000476 TaxID=3154258 RepID=UPI00332338AB
MALFEDRVDAGRALARELGVRGGAGARGGGGARGGADVVVLGLPRGGVPVAAVVAAALHAPLDVLVVRKLGVPAQPELAMGAIGEGGTRVLDPTVVARARVTAKELATVERREREVLATRLERLRRGRAPLELGGRVALVVDDGIATGSTARVACRVARRLGAARVVLAVPVAPARLAAAVPEADAVVCVATPTPFRSVGEHYADFSPTTDDEVVALLDEAAKRVRTTAPQPPVDEEVVVPAGGVLLAAHLRVPAEAAGVVVFAHGSGSSRHSPRNGFVADVLDAAGLGTLLVDLLTADEEADRTNVFDIPLLASRLQDVTRWLEAHPRTRSAPIGWFGASTGAGAALHAAAEPGCRVAAIVSRGGRPDLAGPRLADVRAPTLLVVGGADHVVLRLNRHALTRLRGCRAELAVVPGATHLFEETGALGAVATLARDWFVTHLGRTSADPDAGSRPMATVSTVSTAGGGPPVRGTH